MTTDNKPTTRLMAIYKFFGLLPGQKTSDMMKELKALSEAERDSLGKDCAKALGLSLKEAD